MRFQTSEEFERFSTGWKFKFEVYSPLKSIGALLIPIFMEKLPDELKLLVSRKHKDDWELNSVLEAVKSEVEARERSGIQPTTEKPSPRRPPFHTGINNATASALLSGEGKFSCLFCKGNHRASECHVVTNFEEARTVFYLFTACRSLGAQL